MGSSFRRILLYFAAELCITSCITLHAQAPNALHTQAQIDDSQSLDTVNILDLTPKFLDFYNAAVQSHADPDQRWQLWKEKYDFAAVPPIPAGQKIAREQLDEDWDKYPSAMSRIREGAAGITPPPLAELQKVTGLLGATKPVHIRLIVFVGSFQRSAFSMGGPRNGVSTIAIPVEDSNEDRDLDITHEFTHAVQMQQGHWNGQSVASQIFAEGLAMRVTEHLHPGSPANIYTASTPDWQQQCSAKLPQVLRDLKPHLADRGAEAVSKFIYGTGPAGLKREVYCGGWFVVGEMLQDGMSYPQLGNLSLPEAEHNVAGTIDQMLASAQANARSGK